VICLKARQTSGSSAPGQWADGIRAVAVVIVGCAIAAGLSGPSIAAPQQTLTAAEVNDAQWGRRQPSTAAVLKAQVLLDRARVSPGEIDGRMGENTRKALRAFRRTQGLPSGERLDDQVWHALTRAQGDPVLTTYTITEKDVAGPFAEGIPDDYREKARLKGLDYTSSLELLAEKFHMSQDLLRRLNPDADFAQAGQKITVASVQRRNEPGMASRIEVDSRAQTVTVYGKDDEVIAVYPATVGSRDRPSPTGEFKVTAIAENPVYHYDPELNLRNVDVQEKLDIPPGPNNPVGLVWISLSAKGYGLHGTPDPDKVSKAASHGCVRLTNWDALDLAKHVRRGTPVTISKTQHHSQRERN
jgi:lipoprotein-anchoring transpeptidase ErfK/SrfK